MTRNSTTRLRALVLLAILIPVFAKANDSTARPEVFEFKLPLGISSDVWNYYVPKTNPLTVAKIELGRRLFFDKRLSADMTVSCATCHDPDRAFTDGRRVSEGIGGKRGSRNSPTLLNAMFNSGQFWDGRVESLEAQAKHPLVNPEEMGSQTHDQIVQRLQAAPDYAAQFQEVFGTPVTIDAVAKAIASFERTLVSGNSPLDRYTAGDLNALSESARSGLILFRTRGRCSICHAFNQAFPFLTDGNYRNTGVSAGFAGFDGLARRAAAAAQDDSLPALLKQPGSVELGRFAVTGNLLDIGAYRTPSLRNVELTAPYFHDGSAATLADVVKFYVNGGRENLYRDWQLEPVNLSEDEQRDVVEFLKALTSDDARRVMRNAH
ncbi:MAG TPA: cytochrome c peroxidase [Blastocatellia bacterium]|nr:cytochrome c peroxidase [Blastocatellia bacterium]